METKTGPEPWCGTCTGLLLDSLFQRKQDRLLLSASTDRRRRAGLLRRELCLWPRGVTQLLFWSPSPGAKDRKQQQPPARHTADGTWSGQWDPDSDDDPFRVAAGLLPELRTPITVDFGAITASLPSPGVCRSGPCSRSNKDRHPYTWSGTACSLVKPKSLGYGRLFWIPTPGKQHSWRSDGGLPEHLRLVRRTGVRHPTHWQQCSNAGTEPSKWLRDAGPVSRVPPRSNALSTVAAGSA